MTREIKFRAIDQAYLNWYYSDRDYATGADPSGLAGFFKTHKNDQKYQYTGKDDKIGAGIYAGHIVKHTIESEYLEQKDWSEVIGEVKMIDGCWCVDSSRYPLFSFENEIIGDIITTPHLLTTATHD